MLDSRYLFSLLVFMFASGCGSADLDEVTGSRAGGEGFTSSSSSCFERRDGLESYTVEIQLSGLSLYEASLLRFEEHLVMAFEESNCTVRSSARIRRGRALLFITNYTDGAIYPTRTFFIDSNENDAWDADELGSRIGGGAGGAWSIEITAEELDLRFPELQAE